MPKPEHSADDHRDISEREHKHDDDQSPVLVAMFNELRGVRREAQEFNKQFRDLLRFLECTKQNPQGGHADLATKQDLKEMEKNIMSLITDFVAKQKTFNDRQSAATDGLVTSVGGITGDIKVLNDKIEALQNSPGGITPEDQQLLNELEAAGDALATKVEAAAAAAKTLDELTPPVAPPVQ